MEAEMETSIQKDYRVLALILALVGGVFCVCQKVSAVNIKEFNKDFYNTTGASVPQLKAATVFTWNDQGFPDPTYTVIVDEVVLEWKGEYGNDPTKKIHVGVWLDLDKLPASFKFKHILLTYNTGVIGKVPACAKPEVVYVSEDLVGIDITSPVDDPGITLDEVRYAFRSEPEPLPLRDLNGDNTAIDWSTTPEGFDLNPDQTVRIADVPIPPRSTYILVSARVRFMGDPEAGAGHVFFESALPPLVPAVSQWGLIVLVLLTAAIGAIVIVRRRQRVAV
jgi:hypothetical protein